MEVIAVYFGCQKKPTINPLKTKHICFTTTLRTNRFNVKKFYVVPTLRLCVLYGSQNKQQFCLIKN
jgi:hypothetical protein